MLHLPKLIDCMYYSLPDTFASQMAAESEPTADAALGNITGSNAVNVYLGIGIPWVSFSFHSGSSHGIFAN